MVYNKEFSNLIYKYLHPRIDDGECSYYDFIIIYQKIYIKRILLNKPNNI